jgi:hypothetical protein
MKPISGNYRKPGGATEEVKLICSHYKTWPPPPARMSEDLEVLRGRKEITEALYQQTLVWRKTCGLLEMDEEVCLACSLARKIVRRDLEWFGDHLDGTPGQKLTDWKKAGAVARNRRKPPPRVAAWIKMREGRDGDA